MRPLTFTHVMNSPVMFVKNKTTLVGCFSKNSKLSGMQNCYKVAKFLDVDTSTPRAFSEVPMRSMRAIPGICLDSRESQPVCHEMT